MAGCRSGSGVARGTCAQVAAVVCKEVTTIKITLLCQKYERRRCPHSEETLCSALEGPGRLGHSQDLVLAPRAPRRASLAPQGCRAEQRWTRTLP